MHFHVLGIGSIGSLVAFNLRRAIVSDHPIFLLHNTIDAVLYAQERQNKISVSTHGIKAEARGFRSQVIPYIATHPLREAAQRWENSEPISSLFVCSKAHHVLPALRRLAHRITPSSTIVLLQNGMGILEELLVELFHDRPRPHFILTTNTHGAYSPEPFNVTHTGMGTLDFGIVPTMVPKDYEIGFKGKDHKGELDDITTPDDPEFAHYRSLRNTVAALLRMSQLHPRWKTISEVELAMRRKLVVNSVINPLTALMGCKNGAITTAPRSADIIASVCREASRVYASQTKSGTAAWLSSLEEQGHDIQDISWGRVPLELTPKQLEKECMRVAGATADNISSMLADVRRGNVTEINYLNGFLVSLAKSYGVRVPTITLLRDLIIMRGGIPVDH
ncbi:ketopantoate reductase-like protein [Flagelloscypha sp. PMI_526]|nr:ketopantoate reductase-like protein [Flagelloscypha sp. PMI_526]